MTLRFCPPAYPGGRITLMCGQIVAGAIFPPATPTKGDWRWTLWFGQHLAPVNGTSRNETLARHALHSAAWDVIGAAGLQPQSTGTTAGRE